jgi:hypothetical protein
MLRIPSWKWLSFRPTRELIAGDAPPQSRPCLPALEKLDDRLMFSVSINDTTAPPPSGHDQIFQVFLKEQLALVSNELNALKLAGNLNLDVHQLNNSFLKIDDLITNFGEAILKDDLTAVKIDRTINDLKIEFSKIDALVGGVGENTDTGGELKFVLDTLDSKANELIGLLNTATNAGDLDHKVTLDYLRVADSFLGLDGAVLKATEDAVLARKAGKGQQEYLVIKLNDVIVSSLKIDNPDLQRQLLDLEALTVGLLQSDGGGGNFGGGVTTDGGSTGDVLA